MTTASPSTSNRADEPITVRPRVPLAARLADPVPVGLAGFGLTTFMLSLIEAGIINKSAMPVVLGSALAYGGLLQLLAGMWAFVRNNTFAAVALGSYGAFWISFWALNAFYMSKVPANEQNDALALFLISWGIFSFYMWIVSFPDQPRRDARLPHALAGVRADRHRHGDDVRHRRAHRRHLRDRDRRARLVRLVRRHPPRDGRPAAPAARPVRRPRGRHGARRSAHLPAGDEGR